MVYRNEYSTRRVYTNTSPGSNAATSFSYTLGNGRAGSIPRVAVQKLSAITAPPRSSFRLNELYSELEDEIARGGSGALLPSRRSVTPLRSTSPFRSSSPGPIRSITYHHRNVAEDSPPTTPYQELQAHPLLRNRMDDVLLHLALGLQPPLYSLHHIPLRSALDVKEACDVRRQFVHERNMYDPLSRTQSEIYRIAFNRRPKRLESGYLPGNGTLSCLSYAGGRPIAKRRRFYPEEESKGTEDLKFNNYYKPSAVGSYYSTAGRKPAYQPIYRSKKSLLGLPDTPDSYKKGACESKWESRTTTERKVSTLPRISPPRTIISSRPVESRKVEAPVSDNVSVTLPRPRKSVSDLPEEVLPPPSPTPQQLPVPEESVVFKIPRKSISQEPPEKPLQDTQDDEVTEVVKIKRPSLKPAPSVDPEPVSEEVAEEPQPVIPPESVEVVDVKSTEDPEPEGESAVEKDEVLVTEPTSGIQEAEDVGTGNNSSESAVDQVLSTEPADVSTNEKASIDEPALEPETSPPEVVEECESVQAEPEASEPVEVSTNENITADASPVDDPVVEPETSTPEVAEESGTEQPLSSEPVEVSANEDNTVDATPVDDQTLEPDTSTPEVVEKSEPEDDLQNQVQDTSSEIPEAEASVDAGENEPSDTVVPESQDSETLLQAEEEAP